MEMGKDDLTPAERVAAAVVMDDRMGRFYERLTRRRPIRFTHAIRAARIVAEHNRDVPGGSGSFANQLEYVLERTYGYGPFWLLCLKPISQIALKHFREIYK